MLPEAKVVMETGPPGRFVHGSEEEENGIDFSRN
jgi:hypothetical protein